MNSRRFASVAALSCAALTLAACGADDAPTGSAVDDDRLEVLASFYPLQEAVERVGGSHVAVRNLTKPGGEPHDLELTPKQVLEVSTADAVVYLKDFQPAVDDAVAEAKDTAFDVSTAADLDLTVGEDGHDHAEGDGHDHAEDGHTHEEGSTDPHFWLDPTKYAGVVEAIAEHLGTLDPDHAADYRENATAFVGELKGLDKDFRTGLASCESKDLVTSHAAFGYLAQAYGLTQEGISGLTPESEPSAAQMREVVEHIEEHGVKTVYAETLVPRNVAETIASEAGARVEVLDPLEGITDTSAARDYLGVMKANLATLVKGQGCS